jgi:hypothetical protein
MTEDSDARKDDAEAGGDEMARLRENAAKYGTAYAAFGEAFKGEGMTKVTRLVSWFLVASAVGVVVLAVISKF